MSEKLYQACYQTNGSLQVWRGQPEKWGKAKIKADWLRNDFPECKVWIELVAETPLAEEVRERINSDKW